MNKTCEPIDTLRSMATILQTTFFVFKSMFLSYNEYIFIQISLKCIPNDPIDNKPALVQILGCVEQVTSHDLDR